MKEKMIRVLFEYIYIAIGTLLLAAGMNLFLVPCKLSAGGIGTLGTVLLYIFNVPLSVTNLLLNIVLFIFGYKYLGKTSVIKTIAGIIFLSAALEITKVFSILCNDLFMASVAGGILVGAGVGFVVKKEASTGGSDFAALILRKFFPHIPVASIILIIDCVIIAFSGIVFKSFLITFYSILSMFVSSVITDWFLTIGDSAKNVYILSDKHEEISKVILEKFERGITAIYSKGVYSDNDKIMLMCVVSPKEVPYLANAIRNIDKNAFVIICDVREVLGEGFKSTTDYDKIEIK